MTPSHAWLIPGAAGFIGSHFVRRLLAAGERVVALDALTYAGRRENLPGHPNLSFVRDTILNKERVFALLQEHRALRLVNFAAETHVDNSILSPDVFVETNVNGTHALLDAALRHFRTEAGQGFRYVQVSTDEVYGALSLEAPPFTEDSPLRPNSPYSASKAAGDMLVRAWHSAYGLPTIVTRCGNNYGPRQFPEKLIPRMIERATAGESLPVYGNGANVRDWIHAEDHGEGVYLAATKGRPGEIYCFGGNAERGNLAVVRAICSLLDALKPRADGKPYAAQIAFVPDRPGHDFRYAVDFSKAARELGFAPTRGFEEGLTETVAWHISRHSDKKAAA
jgi:dTDP-glucose 4,6-dehydratase